MTQPADQEFQSLTQQFNFTEDRNFQSPFTNDWHPTEATDAFIEYVNL